MIKNLIKNISKSRRNGGLFALCLVLALTLPLFALSAPTVKAETLKISAFIAVEPNPIGVGQQAQVVFWLSDPPPTALGPSGDRWTGLMVTITKPDGTTETKGPFTSDAVGGSWFLYTPTVIGKYTFKFDFPGQTINGSSGTRIFNNTFFSPSSGTCELVAQQNSVSSIPGVSLPTDYWTRPIYAENKEWSSISGNWLMSNYNFAKNLPGGRSAFAPYTTAPNSAHIMWTKPISFGGLVGAEFGQVSYYTGLSYEQKLTPPTIMNGLLYYNVADPPKNGFYCVDLRTGEELWRQNGNYRLMFGQLFDYESPNQHGVIPYLWACPGAINTISLGSYNLPGGNWTMFNALTGDPILTIINVPTPGVSTLGLTTAIFGEQGEILVYVLNAANNWLARWNSTKAIGPAAATGSGSWQWRPPISGVIDGNKGFEWNVTTPNLPRQLIWLLNKDVIITSTAGWPSLFDYAGVTDVAYDAKTGQTLWTQSRTNVGDQPQMGSEITDNVYYYYARETLQFHGYDVRTGTEIWTSQPLSSAWDMYQEVEVGAYGNFYAATFSGHVYAFNLATGKLVWQFYSGDAGYETPYGTWSYYNGITAADEKIFIGTGEHSPGSDMIRGQKLFALDVVTGKCLWNISGYVMNPAIADGYMVVYNVYDNQIYSFGKGPSATTVSAPQTSVPKGTDVLITGTVTDQSLGQKDTPAISDADMSVWMEYLHMQKPMPTNVKGVPVHLTAIDPNGNFQDIGTATSNIGGTYGISWTPPVPGLYTVTATFEGSNSYGSSYATTYLSVSQAASAAPVVTSTPAQTTAPTSVPTQTPTSPSPSPAVQPPTSSMPVTTYVAIGAAVIIIVVAAAALILRRRK